VLRQHRNRSCAQSRRRHASAILNIVFFLLLAVHIAAVYQASKARVIRLSPRMARAFGVSPADFQEHLMSGTSTPAPAPDMLELAALLSSRVCHDLISPVGAIVNGLEVLDDTEKAEDREFALDLIRKSAKTASARLQFCRLAFGAAGSAGAQIDLGDAQTMARGHLEDGKITITWNLPRLLLPKNKVKLLLNMMVIAQQTIPRGGVLAVDPLGEGDAMSFRVTSTGLNARIPQNIADILSASQAGAIDAHAVQPYYTRLLAQDCGWTVTLAAEGDGIVVSAS
jgi:histidine phosphotransferase ChpT